MLFSFFFTLLRCFVRPVIIIFQAPGRAEFGRRYLDYVAIGNTYQPVALAYLRAVATTFFQLSFLQFTGTVFP